MTQPQEKAPENAPAGIVTEFFAAYRRHDVAAMADLCADNADFRYSPVEIWGKQRVVRGDGKVHGIGRAIWSGQITAFPGLSNEITSLSTAADGTVVAEVTLSGTQAGPWGMIGSRGQQFALPHLFVLHVGADGLIDSIIAYWDNASFCRQLGHAEVD
jgi:ketosteroid isomerase-like protein